MNESLKMVIVLSLIAVISGGSLAVVDSFTRPQIEINKVKAIKEGLKKLIPEASDFEQMEIQEKGETFTVYRGIKGEALIGWGFLLAGSGFQDKISIVAATNPSIKILLGIEILEQKETPGLGDNIKKNDFRAQFRGLSVMKNIGYVKNKKPEPGSNNIQAISAATISSKKVLDIINDNLKKIRHHREIKKYMGEEK
ncbi:MAG: FMN-binding protein [Candidatus Aminicenantes bacterium]|nr:FMN-binding protein [Candidatus Aminicenantes bacterium]